MNNRKKSKKETVSHGVTLLLPDHKAVKGLKRVHKPTDHGHRVWPTTWVLVDFLEKNRIAENKNVLELACGWGLPGIFCARKQGARVTWSDLDEKIYPYLKLLCEKNNVTPDFLHMDINRVGRSVLKDIDVVIASDACFCDTLIDPYRRFINRAKNAGVSQVLISDPGRWPFEDLAELYNKNACAELLDWEITKPVKAEAKILKLSF